MHIEDFHQTSHMHNGIRGIYWVFTLKTVIKEAICTNHNGVYGNIQIMHTEDFHQTSHMHNGMHGNRQEMHIDMKF